MGRQWPALVATGLPCCCSFNSRCCFSSACGVNLAIFCGGGKGGGAAQVPSKSRGSETGGGASGGGGGKAENSFGWAAIDVPSPLGGAPPAGVSCAKTGDPNAS